VSVLPSLRVGLATVLAGALGAAVVLAISGRAASVGAGRPPPEWAKNQGSWPSHDSDLSNTRANLATEIDAHNVSRLNKKWAFRLPYAGPYGAFTSNLIVLGNHTGELGATFGWPSALESYRGSYR